MIMCGNIGVVWVLFFGPIFLVFFLNKKNEKMFSCAIFRNIFFRAKKKDNLSISVSKKQIFETKGSNTKWPYCFWGLILCRDSYKTEKV